MGVGIHAGSISEEIGAPSFLYSFFSTISAHCEPGGWGTRFPYLMIELYGGRLAAAHANNALQELWEVKNALARLSPSAVVWDFENRYARPPWGGLIAPEITDLGNYFVTSAGRHLLAVLEEVLSAAAAQKTDVVIE
jgi:hypothetical protein